MECIEVHMNMDLRVTSFFLISNNLLSFLKPFQIFLSV